MRRSKKRLAKDYKIPGIIRFSYLSSRPLPSQSTQQIPDTSHPSQLLFLATPQAANNYHSISFTSLTMSFEGRLATLDPLIAERVPPHCTALFEAKQAKGLTFEAIAKHLGRSEVACAALFYAQTTATDEDIEKLSQLLDLPLPMLTKAMAVFPNRGHSGPMPPVEPLIYRLYEVVQNYGYAYKAILNEKFGDGIMSAIRFGTKVEKDIDEEGNPWVVITMRGKWLPSNRF
ncbi:Cyanate hydratase [Fusarium oxysporum]|nr:Cyanate hydratase [Fusarium oxysporum]WKT53568.1 Cyanate hydratase [Fusarium oxysporum f. sp. vasinfectum]KAJ4032975.1 Cyanate hydratase [Fusarium oxysporum]KAJ4050856.1 Cyanate hydratase [Fusarium oxysporum]KAJ4073205.1 Cyanate hydratase [Fusarium oxysporum]